MELESEKSRVRPWTIGHARVVGETAMYAFGDDINRELRRLTRPLERTRQAGQDFIGMFFGSQAHVSRIISSEQNSIAQINLALEEVGEEVTKRLGQKRLADIAVTLLRTPPDELGEDRNLHLKKIGYALANMNGFAPAALGLSPDDAVLLGSYLENFSPAEQRHDL